MNNLEKFPLVFNISVLNMKSRLLVEETTENKQTNKHKPHLTKFVECKFILKPHLYTFPEKTESKS